MTNQSDQELHKALLEYLSTKPKAKSSTNFGALCDLVLGSIALEIKQNFDVAKLTGAHPLLPCIEITTHDNLENLITLCKVHNISLSK